jgi:hypothetical protein
MVCSAARCPAQRPPCLAAEMLQRAGLSRSDALGVPITRGTDLSRRRQGGEPDEPPRAQAAPALQHASWQPPPNVDASGAGAPPPQLSPEEMQTTWSELMRSGKRVQVQSTAQCMVDMPPMYAVEPPPPKPTLDSHSLLTIGLHPAHGGALGGRTTARPGPNLSRARRPPSTPSTSALPPLPQDGRSAAPISSRLTSEIRLREGRGYMYGQRGKRAAPRGVQHGRGSRPV